VDSVTTLAHPGRGCYRSAITVNAVPCKGQGNTEFLRALLLRAPRFAQCSCDGRTHRSVLSHHQRTGHCPNGSSTHSLQWVCFWGSCHLYFWSLAHLRQRTVSTRLTKNLRIEEGPENREVLCQAVGFFITSV